MVGGTLRDYMLTNGTETVFNEGSIDLDFRVESNGNANTLFVDGGNDRVGIGNASPLTLSGNGEGLTIKSNAPYILLEDANNANSVLYLANNSGTFNMGIVNDARLIK